MEKSRVESLFAFNSLQVRSAFAMGSLCLRYFAYSIAKKNGNYMGIT